MGSEMSGYNLILKVRRLEEKLDSMGFMMCHSRHSYDREFGDVVAIKPKPNDSLPIYARDAELFVGTIDDLDRWLQGVCWARDYDRMLFGKNHDKARDKKEEQYRHSRFVAELKKEHVNAEATES
jgi:hypothetical protein